MRPTPFIESYRPGGKVIALLGSLRFVGAFHRADTALTLQGAIVFRPPLVTADGTLDDGDRATLEAVTREKIRIADEVLVLDCCRYVGAATQAEIDYASMLGRPIHLLSFVAPDLFQEVSRMPPAPRPLGAPAPAAGVQAGGFGGLPETLLLNRGEGA